MLNPCGPGCQNVPHFLKISQSLLNLIFLLVRLESSQGYDPKHPLVASARSDTNSGTLASSAPGARWLDHGPIWWSECSAALVLANILSIVWNCDAWGTSMNFPIFLNFPWFSLIFLGLEMQSASTFFTIFPTTRHQQTVEHKLLSAGPRLTLEWNDEATSDTAGPCRLEQSVWSTTHIEKRVTYIHNIHNMYIYTYLYLYSV